MLYTTPANKSKLYIVLLSPTTSERKLYVYVNRPISAVMSKPELLGTAPRSVAEIMPNGYKVMTVEVFCATGPDDCTVPTDDVGMVFGFKLMPGIENPTKVLARYAEALGDLFGVSLWEVMLSGRYGQPEPASYQELNILDFPPHYVDHHATVALPSTAMAMWR